MVKAASEATNSGEVTGVRRAAADVDGVTAFAKAAIEAMRSHDVAAAKVNVWWRLLLKRCALIKLMKAYWKQLLTKEH